MARPSRAAHPAVRTAAAVRTAVPVAALTVTALSLGACGHNPYATQLSERECLARAMYFESNRSSEDGMLAVGTVVMNRVQSQRYPKTVCGVVGQPNQFADGALSKPAGGRSYAKALQVAEAVIGGDRHEGVGNAMFFHTAGYTFPYRNMAYVVAAGGNVFYEKKTPGTFTPIHPATLVAQAEPNRARRAALVQVASADEDDVAPAPAPRRMREERTPLPREERSLDLVRPRPEPVAQREPRRREPPIMLASLAAPPARKDKGPPTIAELIELDMGARSAKTPLAINRDGGRR